MHFQYRAGSVPRLSGEFEILCGEFLKKERRLENCGVKGLQNEIL